MSRSNEPVVLAHAVGIRADLPVSLWLVLVAGSLALVVSFVALSALWHTSRLRGDSAGWPLPRPVQSVLDSPLLRWTARLVVLALAVFVVVVALVGSREASLNLSPYAFYVTFWVGIVPASLLLGPVWRAVNPLRTLHALLQPLTGPAPAADRVERLGVRPAVGFLLAFTWLELVYPDRGVPQTVGIVLVLYTAVHLVAALWYGEGWFERGDAFEVWSTLLGRFSVLGRRGDGRLVLRNPLDGSDGTPQLPGLALFVTAMIGSTGFDGVTRATWWQSRVDSTDVLLSTVGLLVTVLLVTVLFYLATAAATLITARRAGAAKQGPTRPLLQAAEVYAHTLVPIAAGYAIAHYFSLLVLEGQLTWILASDPFYSGADLFGTKYHEVDLTVVSPTTISVVQVSAIVLGHVLGVVLAHDRAVRLAGSRRTALLSQLPLLAVMVAFTCGGLALLLG